MDISFKLSSCLLFSGRVAESSQLDGEMVGLAVAAKVDGKDSGHTEMEGKKGKKIHKQKCFFLLNKEVKKV